MNRLATRRQPGPCRRWAAALGLVIGAFVACAQPAADLQGTPVEGKPGPSGEAALLAPRLGRPVFVVPGGVLTILASWPQLACNPQVTLVSDRTPAVNIPLSVPDDVVDRLERGDPLMLPIPEDAPPRTYDLEVLVGGGKLSGRHCVAVVRPTRRIRLVHLSNMNVGDLGVTDFDWRLVQEINLLAPTLIIATGDYLDVTHPDPEAGWQRLVDFFCAFDAPALLACGDHDDLALYSRYVAPSPVGVVEVGRLRGVVLYDLPAAPMPDDTEQRSWFERLVTRPGDDRVTFVVAHDARPNLLAAWADEGRLGEMVRATRLGLWFAGGFQDWDGVEYRSLVEAADPLLYVRTQAASPCTRGGADGISHYRIIDVEGQQARVAGEASGGELPPSLPVGRLRVTYEGPNDGTRERVTLTATNGHPFRLDGLEAQVRVSGSAGQRPWCAGAELLETRYSDGVWVVTLRFDLPDKGARRMVVGSGTAVELPSVDVLFDAGDVLVLERRQTPEGLTYASAAGPPILVHLANRGSRVETVTPLIRLDGETLAYDVLDSPQGAATAYRLRVVPGQTVTLQPDLGAIRVAPGRRELQVYLQGPPAWVPACHALEVELR